MCLPSSTLLQIYSSVGMTVILSVSYYFNYEYLRREPYYLNLLHNIGANTTSLVSIHASIIFLHLQLILIFIFNVFHMLQPSIKPFYVTILPSYLHVGGNTALNYIAVCLPSLLYVSNCPKYILHYAVTFSSLFNTIDLTYHLFINMRSIQHLPIIVLNLKILLRQYGIEHLIVTQWNRLKISRVLAVYWLIRMTWLAGCLIVSPVHNIQSINMPIVSSNNHTIDFNTYKSLLHSIHWPSCSITEPPLQNIHLNYWAHLLVLGCNNLLSVISMGNVICYASHFLGLLLSRFMDCEDDRLNLGTMCCTVFIILALQTGLTGLTIDKRLVRLHQNFCLLFTAVVHFIHTTLDDLILRLAASHNMCISRHFRLLSLCAVLIFCPLMLIYYLWQIHVLSTWLLAVTAFSVEIIIKVIVTLLQYSLFVIDSTRMKFWERLDDYIYYIKSVGSTIEFIFGVLLFCNGLWVMFFESGSTIRAVMMGIHAYFNIWEEARNGWKTFMKRKTAVQKINWLPMATPEQLHEHNDVCAICYSELKSAHVTHCNHLFHGVCLRKWLYISETCPMCHDTIYNPEDLKTPNTEDN